MVGQNGLPLRSKYGYMYLAPGQRLGISICRNFQGRVGNYVARYPLSFPRNYLEPDRRAYEVERLPDENSKLHVSG